MIKKLAGDGTDSDPYIIETIDEFLSMADPEAHYELNADLDFSNIGSYDPNNSEEYYEEIGMKLFKIQGLGFIATIVAYMYTNSLLWTFLVLIGSFVVTNFALPSGTGSVTEEYPSGGFIRSDEVSTQILDGEDFNGEFNGNGHEISNATFVVSEDSGGVFNDIGEDGIVYDIQIHNFQVFSKSITGIIAGENRGTIGFVRVSDSTIEGKKVVGSVVGQNNEGTISRCISEGCSVSGENNVGGFCGINGGYIHESEVIDVECECTGENKICGGFLGVSVKSPLVINCRAEGRVVAEETEDERIHTGEFAGIHGDIAVSGNGVLLHNFASVKGCQYGITAMSQYLILNCYYNKDLCVEDAYYATRWFQTLPTRGLHESEMVGEDALSNMDWLDQEVWENSNTYPRQKSLNHLDNYWNYPSEKMQGLLGHPVDVSWLKSVEEWAEEVHEAALNSPVANNNVPKSTKSKSSSRSNETGSSNNRTGSTYNDKPEKIAIKSTGSLLTSGAILGYIEGDMIIGTGGLFTEGKIVAELDDNIVSDTSGLLTGGDPIAEIDGNYVKDIRGLLPSGDILAVIDGDIIRDKSGILSSGDQLAIIDGDATNEQKGAAAAAIVLGKIKE